MAKLNPKPKFEALLRQDLTCFHCSSTLKNIPALKEHLQEEWDQVETREKARMERKRKMDARKNAKDSDLNDTAKRQETEDQVGSDNGAV